MKITSAVPYFILFAATHSAADATTDASTKRDICKNFIADECSYGLIKTFFLGWADNWDELAAIGSFAAAIATTVTALTVYFVWTQVRAEKVARETQTILTTYQIGIDVLKIMMERPYLRPYLYEGKELPDVDSVESSGKSTSSTRNELWVLLEIMVDHWESIYFTNQSLNRATDVEWKKYMRGIYKKSPELQKFLKEEREGYRYSKELRDMLQFD